MTPEDEPRRTGPADRIAVDDPRAPDVLELLHAHLSFARGESPREDAHALDPEDLIDPDIEFVGYRRDGRLLAIGALKRIDDTHAELKSMHTRADARGQGIGRRLVNDLLERARAQGFTRVSIETGSMAAFAPARALYAGAGFSDCPPFAGYVENPNSSYMTLALE